MKLRNKKTGGIVEDAYVRETHDFQFDGQKHVLAVFKSNGHRPPERLSGPYNSLAELNEEWEDAPEEPKEHWFIDAYGNVRQMIIGENEDFLRLRKEIGNDFDAKEGGKKAVEKLKAWQRLSENKYLFSKFISLIYSLNGNSREFDEYMDDILLLFGDE